MNAMGDFKPVINPGYTGQRHDDKPESLSREQVGVLSFVAGMMFFALISVVMGALV